MSIEEFKKEIFDAIKDYPKDWRTGQKIFNYIDCKYKIARKIQLEYNVDCFYKDYLVDNFIITAYKILYRDKLFPELKIGHWYNFNQNNYIKIKEIAPCDYGYPGYCLHGISIDIDKYNFSIHTESVLAPNFYGDPDKFIEKDPEEDILKFIDNNL